ncbi:hypothetical protein BSKO_05090 [Bryopsis sp. KO-2023]|nr:hypothetical protein BSKO_05090 [Bryopsis sp. KO-2023]
MPRIKQVLVKAGEGLSGDDLERELFSARKLIEKASAEKLGGKAEEFYICTLSSRVIAHKYASKISPYELGTERTRAACEGVLQRLATDYVDLVLIHWPGASRKKLNSVQNSIKRMETWKVLEEYHRQGRCDPKSTGFVLLG